MDGDLSALRWRRPREEQGWQRCLGAVGRGVVKSTARRLRVVSVHVAPLNRASLEKPAAGYTAPDVPTARKW